MPSARARRARAWAAGVLALGLLACQPAAEPALDPETGVGEADAGAESRGAPEFGGPANLAEALDRAREPAREWQDEPRVAEIATELDGDALVAVRLTYLAADADRMLFVELDEDGISEQRPTLETLELPPIAGDAIDELPSVEGDLAEPGALAEAAADALAECDAGGDVARVLYTTGAPASWDGEQWTTAPEWSATVLTDDGGAEVDPSSGAATGRCL